LDIITLPKIRRIVEVAMIENHLKLLMEVGG